MTQKSHYISNQTTPKEKERKREVRLRQGGGLVGFQGSLQRCNGKKRESRPGHLKEVRRGKQESLKRGGGKSLRIEGVWKRGSYKKNLIQPSVVAGVVDIAEINLG